MSGFNFPSNDDLGLPDDIYGSGAYYTKDDYTADLEEKPEDNFLNRFMKNLEEGGYFKQSKDDSRNYDIYGDRRRKSGGDTVTDLGGGNTLSSPDSSAVLDAQMAALQRAGQKSPGQQLGGGIGAALGGAVGGPLAPVTSVLGRFAGDFLGGLF
tara:strand:- start:38 stop:499 length:462 start_codon:yes stop_codon:yes gene_type:complete